jgi:hypothetical protein
VRLRLVLVVLVAVLVAGFAAGSAGATGKTEPRCCVKTGGGGGLPLTGLPLYVPVLASLGLLGAGVALRLRARES